MVLTNFLSLKGINMPAQGIALRKKAMFEGQNI